MSLKTAALAILSVCLATAGQLVLKAGMDHVGRITGARMGNPVKLVTQVATTPLVLVGLALFGVSALFWLIVLSRWPLSYAYPFAGLVYVFVTAFDRIVHKQTIPALRWAGVALIVLGIVVVGRTGGSQTAEPVTHHSLPSGSAH
jgi:drug/metabolite transporter (DMT)-like permease